MKRSNNLILFIIIAASFEITGVNFEDFTLENYDPHSHINGAIAV